ncbi:GIY-YIG nuclease family protein [Iningainema tapete]|uniref:GIY-YIG nuclease family protein n=1 Tax=Iningainema tapete BLCC-T55 TaxID=2748662 RepID=A0A8J7BWN2_9CYAN|nr:GIY-YIG nuclease family protein [Iningainema tapete]MBD2772142.1 GIY-YIG nuclease family protein [Iningainema tapete BLCC-T55]
MEIGEKIPSYPCCYLIELSEALGNEKHSARYYLGSCANLKKRFQQHLQGTGAAFTRAAVKRGIQFKIVHIWRTSSKQEARQLEIQLKRQKNHAKLLRRVQDGKTTKS